MPIWKLRPVADPSDSRWLDHEYKKPLLVSAATAAQARLKARKWYLQGVYERIGNESAADRSAFDDEKLYQALRIEDADAERRRHPELMLVE